MTHYIERHPPPWTDFLAAQPAFFAPPRAVFQLGDLGSGGRWAVQQAAATVAAAGTPVVVLDDAANGWAWLHLARGSGRSPIQALPAGTAPAGAGLTLYEGSGDPALVDRLLIGGAPAGGGVLVLTALAGERAGAPYAYSTGSRGSRWVDALVEYMASQRSRPGRPAGRRTGPTRPAAYLSTLPRHTPGRRGVAAAQRAGGGSSAGSVAPRARAGATSPTLSPGPGP